MRVVIDTNILISALISPNGVPFQSLKLWGPKYQLVTSEWQIDELRRVSRRKALKPYLKRIEVGTFINELREKASVQGKLPEIDVSPDPDDNNIIATAIAGGAHYIVSGDKRDLLSLRKAQGIPIITAREFVKLFAL